MSESARQQEFYRNVWCLLGLPFDAIDMETTLRMVHKSAKEKSPCFISTPNINFLVASQSDSVFRDSVIKSDLSIADGMPLIWISHFLGFPFKERVAGSGLIEALQENRYNDHGSISIFFFGGEEGIAERACERLNIKSGNLKCVGSFFPGFGSVADMSRDEVIKKINHNDTDFLIVSLGAKKGQAWIVENKNKLNAPIVSHLGAVVNFIAGTVKRAPRWMQITGLEWVWRILQEPSLWRRYVSDGIILLKLVVTRVLPYKALLIFRNKKLDEEDVEVIIKETEEIVKIILKGSLTTNKLMPLREAFLNATVIKKNIQIDFSKVSYLDASFLGILMLLYKHAIIQNKRFTVVSVSKYLKRIFVYNQADYLLLNT